MIPVGRPPSRGSYPWQRPPCILCPWLSRQTGPRPGFINVTNEDKSDGGWWLPEHTP